MEEVWKDIPNYKGNYMVSNLGNVKSLKKDIILKSNKCNSGYLKVSLSKNDLKKTFMIHTLVAVTFYGHKPNGQINVVNHINLNKLDNRLENLEIITQRENSNQKHIKSTSKYIGVCIIKRYKTYNLYRASIRINSGPISLGDYQDELLASEVYQIALKNIDKFNGNRNEFRQLIRSLMSEDQLKRIIVGKISNQIKTTYKRKIETL